MFGLFFCFLSLQQAQLTAHIPVIATEVWRVVVPIRSAEKLAIIARTIPSVALASVVTRATARQVVLVSPEQLSQGSLSL